MGQAFDIVAERAQTEYKQLAERLTEMGYTITIRNHKDQDIEATMQSSHPALRPNCGVAFSYVDHRGLEKLVLVQEVERTQRHQVSTDEIEKRIREAISNEHDIAVHEIVLIRPGSIPKTTSGKIQRRACRAAFLEGTLDVVAAWPAARAAGADSG